MHEWKSWNAYIYLLSNIIIRSRSDGCDKKYYFSEYGMSKSNKCISVE